MPFSLLGQRFTAEELGVAPSPADAALYIDRYDAVASLLVGGFHYANFLSEARLDQGAAPAFEASLSAPDELLTRLYELDGIDIYVDAGWIARRPDLLEVYPYERHLRSYVEMFRQRYRRERGRL
jgi:hypothetical protein